MSEHNFEFSVLAQKTIVYKWYNIFTCILHIIYANLYSNILTFYMRHMYAGK